jgi:transcriptional regulator with XRE-family HTH domain
MEDKTGTFGSWIRMNRNTLCLSQAAVAKSAGISRVYLSHIENDKAENISAKVLWKLLTALRINKGYGLELYGRG